MRKSFRKQINVWVLSRLSRPSLWHKLSFPIPFLASYLALHFSSEILRPAKRYFPKNTLQTARQKGLSA